MRAYITFYADQPGHIDQDLWIVEDPTVEEVSRWVRAVTDSPDEVLTIENVRTHQTVDTPGTATLRAGRITDIRTRP